GGIESQPADIAFHAALVEVQSQARGRHEHVGGRRANPKVACQRKVRTASVYAAMQHDQGDGPRFFDCVHHLVEGDRARAAYAADVIAAAEVLSQSAELQHEHLV